MAEAVRSELRDEGRLLRLILDKPKGNVLTFAVMEELRAALLAHERDPMLRLVVLQGAGGHFSFGASVEEHRREQAPRMLRAVSQLVRAVALYPAPIAALVEGRCLGGAFELALACHLVLARPDAQLGCPEIKLGVFPPVLAALGPWRLGGALSERMLLTGETLSASALHASGFVAALVEGEPLEYAERYYRERFAPLSAASLRLAVQASRRGADVARLVGAQLDAMEALYVDRVLPSHDGNEGIEAFLAKRPPRWEDR